MKMKFLSFLLCFLPVVANAAIPYRSEQRPAGITDQEAQNDSEAFARLRRFYIGAGYNFTMWQDKANNVGYFTKGQDQSSFDLSAGVRIYDTFRLDVNYYHLRAQWATDWSAIRLSSETIFLNAIFDGRIDSSYRFFRKQMLVPYIGVGAGLSWNSTENIAVENKISPVVSAMTGISFEIGDRFALDFGYKYIYMFAPKFIITPEIQQQFGSYYDCYADMKYFSPTAHQFRIGARVNF